MIKDEASEIKRRLRENEIPNAKIVVCTVEEPALIRVDIKANEVHRQLTVCLRFPAQYPNQTILVELKSRYLSSKFLDGLATLCESQARQHLGKPQGLHVLRFVQQYLHENPLCVCVEEIHQLRHDLGPNATSDQIKLKQRLSTLIFTAKGGAYYYRVLAIVPDEYPLRSVDLQKPESNLPAVLLRYLNGQSKEIARQCVEPPLRLAKDKNSSFQPAPSLYRSLKFCLEATRDFHAELCPICDISVLPADPNNVEMDDTKDAFVERVYCGHLYHQGCLKNYLQTPPFRKGGKLCPAKSAHARSDASYYLGGGDSGSKRPTVSVDASGSCNERLAHDRWVVSVKVAETRWAQKQARERELQEVVDFLN